MNDSQTQLNRFLVEVFHDVLRLEEQSLTKGKFQNLSVSEMHVIEAVVNGQAENKAGMAALAAKLQVSAGTLTIAVKTLEQKGYLLRCKTSADRRRVTVAATPLGQAAFDAHQAFHHQLIDAVAQQLPPRQLNSLASALSTLHHFFDKL